MHSFTYLYPLLTSLATLHQTIAQEVSIGINTYLNTNEKLMSTRVGSFLGLVSQGLFVDKTLLINDLLEKPHWHYIITCPNKWGKTLNLDMLKTFLSMQVHPNGTRMLPISSTPNYQLFTKSEYHRNGLGIKLDKPLLISKDTYRHVIDKYLGKHPVIHLSFAGVPWIGDKRHTMLAGIITKAYQDHIYMLEIYDSVIRDRNAYYSYEVEEVETAKNKFNAYLNNQLKEEDLVSAIEFLRDELYSHFNSTVFIMIDEYDRILEVNHNVSTIDYFFSTTLRNHPSLEKAILTGTVRKSIDLHGVFIHKFFNNPYYPYYGFTRKEMELLYDFFEILPEKQKLIEYWYGGYKVSTPNITDTVFNPWSVSKHLNSRFFRPYWMETQSRDVNLHKIIESMDFQNVFGRLISGKNYDVDYSGYSNCARIWRILDVVTDVKQALQYLKGTGYLTTKIKDPRQPSVYTYKIPNYEIASYLPTIFACKLNRLFKNRYTNLLKTGAQVWERALLGNEFDHRQMENHTQRYFKFLAGYFEKEYDALGADSWILTLIMSTIGSKQFTFVSWQFVNTTKFETSENARQPDIVLSSKDKGVMVDVYLHKKNITEVDNTDRYIKMFEEYPRLHSWKSIQIIVFNVMSNRHVEIKSTLHSLQPVS